MIPTQESASTKHNANYEHSSIVRTEDIKYKTYDDYDCYRQVVYINNSPPIIFLTSYENKDEIIPYCPEGTVVSGVTAKDVIEIVKRYSDNPDISSLYKELASKDYGQLTTDYCDMVIASMCIGKSPDGTMTELREPNTSAIAEVISALTGDEQIQKELSEKVLALRDIRENYQKENIQKQRIDNDERRQRFIELTKNPELDINNVVLVHVTTHKPEKDENGNVLIWPTANFEIPNTKVDGTAELDNFGEPLYYAPVARGTIHFTVNSRVENHIYGNGWESDGNWIIVVSLGEMIKNGEVPVAANTVDTYFGVDPGEVLILPGATVVEPTPGESLESNKVRLQTAMRQQGARAIFDAGPHYLQGYYEDNDDFINPDNFSRAFYQMCVDNNIPVTGLHMGTPDSNIETAYYNSDSSHYPGEYIRACVANQKWAALNGRIPTHSRVYDIPDEYF